MPKQTGSSCTGVFSRPLSAVFLLPSTALPLSAVFLLLQYFHYMSLPSTAFH